ncbi:hypothetical protein PAXINDRAFT_19348 [Paxillus involutus ATCC 200175]|uniref:Unplaced genomic scaffold PAXINscaffold_561, whole genome shotgun sequence n=1 Tax=Paxillus involutus ATCC 200175 TaxID=664439 RepID=A0A0C9SX04_PAXIN|nr:hypothetical protein PAXINDRAFT_19348 [Paxillus involutus ATCC 200175]
MSSGETLLPHANQSTDRVHSWILVVIHHELYPSGHSESAMKASWPGNSKPLTRPSNANAWCEHHLSTAHNTSDCNTYKKWVSELRKGGFRKLEKGKDKANAAEDPPEAANIANEVVSQLAMKRIHAYLSSEPENSGRNTLIMTLEHPHILFLIGRGFAHIVHYTLLIR